MNFIKINNYKPLIFQSIGRLSAQGLGFLLGVVIVRVSGLEIMGQFAKYNALINISFGVFASGLYTNYLRSNDLKLLGQTVSAITIFFLFFLSFFSPLYIFFTGDKITNVILILLSIYFMKLSEVYVVTSRFLNSDHNSVLPRVIPYLIVIGLCLIFKPDNVFFLLCLLSFSWLSIIFFYFKIREKIKLKRSELKQVFCSSFLLSLTTLATQIYANFDQLMIVEILKDYNKLGSYKIGVSFSNLAMPLIGVFSFMYISEIKQLIKNSTIAILKKKFYNQLKINLLVSFSFLVFCICLLRLIISIIYNIDDASASNAGIILSIGVIFNVLSMVFSYSLLAINKDKEILVITLFGALINIVLNYIFILKFGILGAAFTSALTQLIVLLIYIYVFYKKVEFFNVLNIK
ncbi:MATE family efflux transporter [Seonamhaeicola marinus]|uniref:Uncharacterized protein n=1 Tax=Seonamhaeicola marinus TaxID=1912246 RepID=A0A5D0HUI1_9FLAO|nr:polysaccharide biosynthesis C-terminal domain-containing protein [Seonamhaeicola marinus]TYA74129.1 hypothetical protein FUA24_12360 [Seonamhaeicola marinus]